jgi:hypothetical protein
MRSCCLLASDFSLSASCSNCLFQSTNSISS